MTALPTFAQSNTIGDEVLTADKVTTTTWQAVRLRLNSHVVHLRASVRVGGAGLELTKALENFQEDLSLYDQLAERLAHENAKEIEATRARLDRLLDLLAGDYDRGTDEQITSTLRLVEETVARIEELSLEADRLAGRRETAGFLSVPDDWGELTNPAPDLRIGLVLLNADELRHAIEDRRSTMQKTSWKRLTAEHERLGREVAEIGRALLKRQGEFPALSRPGFCHAAMRIEVIGDNLVDFAKDDNRLNYRRQLLSLEEALERVDSYIRLKEELRATAYQ